MATRRTRIRVRRRRVAIAALVLTPLLLVAAIVGIGVAASPSERWGRDVAGELPPNAGQITPGNLIDDELFYDRDAMDAGEIQRFLDEKIGPCRNERCLNVLTTAMSDRDELISQSTGERICGPIEGGRMRVSEAVFRVQQACGISARAIVVILQKEQGLVSGRTAQAPSERRLQTAMGASCPDDAPCDPRFEGVGAQLVAGVTDLASYRASRFMRQPGTHVIGFHPDPACGATEVTIENDATAALYNYTPYQPNDAAMQAGWGTGDGCSSYGNRNFSYYFALWFGSVRAPLPAG